MDKHSGQIPWKVPPKGYPIYVISQYPSYQQAYLQC